MHAQTEIEKMKVYKEILTPSILEGIKGISGVLNTNWELDSVSLVPLYPAELALMLVEGKLLSSSTLTVKQPTELVTLVSNEDAIKLLSYLMDAQEHEDLLDEFGLSAFNEVINHYLSAFTDSLSKFLGQSIKYSQPKTKLIASADQGLSPFEAKIMNMTLTINYQDVSVKMHVLTDFACIESLLQPQLSKKKDTSEASDVKVKEIRVPKFSPTPTPNDPQSSMQNLDMIMNVPLQVSVEIGRAKKKIKDIMNMSSGYVLELEKQLGAPVDIVVNGQLIARGDVVVIDENFAIRITEIVNTAHLLPQE